MDKTDELCELQHYYLRDTILSEVQRREEQQNERFLSLINELREEIKESKKEISSIKDITIQGFVALIITIVGSFVSFILLNFYGVIG